MNRRDLLTSTGAGMALGFCAAVVVAAPGCAPVEAPAAERDVSPLATAIEAHRAAVQHDEGLYDANGNPLEDLDALDASDEAMAAAFLAVAAAPCRSMQEAAAKVRYILAGPVGIRCDDWREEYLDALTGPDGANTFDPNGPLVAFLRSLLPVDTDMAGQLEVAA